MNNINEDNIMNAKDYFSLANSYLNIYSQLAELIQDPEISVDELNVLYDLSEPIFQKAYEFQRMGFKSLTSELNVPVTELREAIQDASNTIKRTYRFGKIIKVISDLIGIAAIIAVPVLKQASLIALPDLFDELKNDVNELKS